MKVNTFPSQKCGTCTYICFVVGKIDFHPQPTSIQKKVNIHGIKKQPQKDTPFAVMCMVCNTINDKKDDTYTRA